MGRFLKTLLLTLLLISTSEASIGSLAGKQCRSSKVKHQFDVAQGYPKGRKGYVVDHVCALSVGGLDSPLNMQYQTLAESKLKDLIEGTLYGKTLFCTPLNSTPVRAVFNC